MWPHTSQGTSYAVVFSSRVCETWYDKQVLVAFAIMSGRTVTDYMAILHKLLDLLPETASIQTVTTDFEGVLWLAVCSNYALFFRWFNFMAACFIIHWRTHF